MNTRKSPRQHSLIGWFLLRLFLPASLAGLAGWAAGPLYLLLACVGGCGGYGELIFAVGFGSIAAIVTFVAVLAYDWEK